MNEGPLTVAEALESDRPDWDAFVAARDEADILQLWAWGEVVAAAGAPAGSNGEHPRRLIARAAGGRVRAIAQALVRPTSFGRSVVYVPRGPIWEREAADGGEVLAAILDALGELARDDRAIVVKVDPRARLTPGDASESGQAQAGSVRSDADEVSGSLRAAGLRPAPFHLQAPTTRVIELDRDESRRIATWSSGARNLWRRAAREGTETTVVRSADADALTAFSELHERTAERAAFRLRPPGFYRALADELAPAGGFHLALATHGGRTVAAMYVVGVGDRAYYLYGASDRDAPQHSNGPYAAMGAMLEALADDGVRTFDLWGVAEPDDPESDAAWAGFSAFKAKFDGTPVRHPGTFDLVTDPFWWRVRRLRERLSAAR